MTFEELMNIDTGMGSTIEDYKFLYGFISLIKPRTILEIGTNHGGSSAAMAMALRDAGLTGSRIVSIDVNEGYLETAKAQLEQLGLQDYVFLRHGDSSLAFEYSHFDIAFIDGDHTYEGVFTDFNNVKNKATYVLLHDSVQEEGSSRAVKAIGQMKSYEVFNVNKGEHGTQWSLGKPVYDAYPGIAIVTKRRNAKGITGIVLFDHYTAQTWSAVTMLARFLTEHHDITRIVELGTGTGGLTLFFGANLLQRDGKVLSFDIADAQSEEARRDFEKLNIDFRKVNVLTGHAEKIAKEFIGAERALIFCDNGRKPDELLRYARILKKDDIIMVHDWGIEITPRDLDEQILSKLEPYHQDEFDREETYILCMKRV